MPKEKKSFFERLTGAVKLDREEEKDIPDLNDDEIEESPEKKRLFSKLNKEKSNSSKDEDYESEDEERDGQLTVDVYENNDSIVLKTMVAGVRPEDLDIMITREMVTIKGKREEDKSVADDNYFIRELYWGSFSRTVTLPEEVDVEEAEAVEKHGLLIIKLPKQDKSRQAKLRVKTI